MRNYVIIVGQYDTITNVRSRATKDFAIKDAEKIRGLREDGIWAQVHYTRPDGTSKQVWSSVAGLVR